MLLRAILIAVLCLFSRSIESKRFEYSCFLEDKPTIDSKFPTIKFKDGQNLQLYVSHRVSHQIVTRIFAIFLKEVLDYSDTEIIENEPANQAVEIYSQVFPLIQLDLDAHSNPAINLQVWMPPEPHDQMHPFIGRGHIFQGNTLTNDIFRYGLFVKKSTSSKSYSYKDFVDDANGVDSLVGDFMIKDQYLNNDVLKDLQKNLKEDQRVFQPKFCLRNAQRCATVLTSHREDMRFFIDHIERFKLRMNLYFLGDNLQKVINKLEGVNKSSNNISTNKGKLLLKPSKYFVLHWNNSEIIDSSYEAITMPPCELYFDMKNQTNVCRYEITPVSIFYNRFIIGNENPGPIFKTLAKVNIDSVQSIFEIYRKFDEKLKTLNLLTMVKENFTESIHGYYNDIACQWLNKHKEVYQVGAEKSWIHSEENTFREVFIGGLFPNMSDGPEYRGVHIAAKMIENYLADKPFGDYKIKITNYTSDCKPDVVLRNFVNLFSNRQNLIGVIGPSCTEAIEPLALISKHYKLNVITYSAEGISFDDRENYPYFYRTIGETNLYQQVYEKLLTEWNWKRIFALTEDGMKYTQYITALESRLKEADPNFWFLNKKFARDTDKNDGNFINHLRELKEKNRAKIIIADVHDHNLMKSIMCAANELKMTAQSGFVWFLPVYVSMKINDTLTLTNSTSTKNGMCTDLDIRNAMQGHFAFSYSSFAEDSVMLDEGISVREWHEKYKEVRGDSDYSLYDDYGGFSYDALWVYVKAVKALISESDAKGAPFRYMNHLESDQTMKKLSEIINNMTFQGVSGKIQFKNGSRYIDVNILQWQENTFKLVGTFQPKIVNGSNVGNLTLNDTNIKWPNNDRPKDGSEICTLLPVASAIGLDCYAMTMMLIILSCFAIFLVCSLSALWVWKRKYEKRLDEVANISNSYHKVVNGIELSEREVRRENVVINRRIGEGQFGMVYGGEALIAGKTEGWQAVAIKTLKPGADVSSRVDFLAESETMKKFDHPNIVNLLGVCLQKEPLYAIMEFMLYGDLKTYLLARRNLLNFRISDDSDISPKKLTLMALDVARGLSYLSSMNYVHRDIACRNCMINAERVVKIGDFGLARKTYEKDYYKFSRSGPMPVRWMPKESLTDGNFSHASDMWAYGVVLYEIITLGGFPFQGLSDQKVMDIVKSNGSINIPSECKSELRAIMTTCFNSDPQKRPKASTLVEYVLRYPRIVTACRTAPQPNLENEEINTNIQQVDLLDWESQWNRDFPNCPIVSEVDVLRTSASLPVVSVQNNAEENHDHEHNFEYMDMKPRNLNLLPDYNPDLTATLPNSSIYNPIEPLLHRHNEISKNNNSSSIMRYMPMCGKRNNRSSPEEGIS